MPHQDSLTLDDQVRPTITESWSILSSPYRLTTIGIVSLVALIAFEALAVATAMPAVARALDGVPLYAVAFGVTLATSVVGMTVAGGWCDARGPAAPLWSGMACFVAGLLLAGFAPSVLARLTRAIEQGMPRPSVNGPRCAKVIRTSRPTCTGACGMQHRWYGTNIRRSTTARE